MDTPASLLDSLRRPGEQEAWKRFVKLYTPLLCHWSRRLGLDGHDVSDLVQDVFAILVRKLPEFVYDGQKSFRGWLWTITVNKCREKGRHPAPAVLDPRKSPLANLPLPPEAGIEVMEYQQYLIQRIVQIIQTEFAPTTWKAFWESVVEERSPQEVAGRLGLSVDAIYTAKSRVLRRLRHDLRGLLD